MAPVKAEPAPTQSENSKDSPLFSAGEKVLAYHGPMIYGAKVQKVELKTEGWRFLVHYSGWSKKWDEWVPSDRLLKENAANIAKKEKIFRDAAAEKRKNNASAAAAAAAGAAGAAVPAAAPLGKEKGKGEAKVEKEATTKAVSADKGKKRKASESTAEETKQEQEQMVKIPLLPSLKKQLVDDWRSITQEGRLVKLPRKPTVADVLQKYLEAKTKKDSASNDNTAEVSNGLRAYFDRALPAILLYKQERGQYSDAFPEGTALTPAEVYGAEHLLRLFIKLPELLSYIQMEEETLDLLLQKLAEFLKFLQKNQNQFFLQLYDGPKVDIDSKDAPSKSETAKSAKGDVKKEKR